MAFFFAVDEEVEKLMGLIELIEVLLFSTLIIGLLNTPGSFASINNNFHKQESPPGIPEGFLVLKPLSTLLTLSTFQLLVNSSTC